MKDHTSQLESPPQQKRLCRWAVQGLVFLLVTWWLPAWWCGRGADVWFAGEAQQQRAMLESIEHWVDMELSSDDFGTGSELFNGEWLFGTYMMAAMGAGQMAIEQPNQREQCLAVMEKALDKLFAKHTRAFDRSQWGADAIETLDDPAQHHAAYLGYANMALSLHRLLKPESRYAELNDRITAALAARLDSSPLLLLETYPNEMYPVDNSAVIGSIGLYDRATGADHSDLLMRCEKKLRSNYIDNASGLMIQAVNSDTGVAVDQPRGSGTALGLYFLSFSHPKLAAELWQVMATKQKGHVLNFGMMREYPPGVSGWGDVDSGPVIFGYGVSPSGFALAGARIFGDEDTFRALYATTVLFGGPGEAGDRHGYLVGGPIGDTILFAMLTAQPAGALNAEAGK